MNLIEIGALDDAIIGAVLADRMVGLGGDDDFVGLAGNDSLFGRRGKDVLSSRANDDRLFGGADIDVLEGGNGNYVLEGGAGADILGGVGSDSLSFTRSAAAVNINLTTAAASGGDAAGDLYRGFENLVGSGQNDTLTGNALANRIEGGNGNDLTTGLAGADNLFGEHGNDTISGDDQNDRLSGDAGADTLSGGAAGGTLNGGGAGADVLVFGLLFGDEEIQNLAIAEDRLDLSLIPGINSLAQFQAAAITFAANTLLSKAFGSTVAILGVTEGQCTTANFRF